LSSRDKKAYFGFGKFIAPTQVGDKKSNETENPFLMPFKFDFD
jgi:hypothetical protein